MTRLRLKELRAERELSIRALADKAGLDFSHLHKIEIGQISPTLATLDRLAEALGVTVPELIITTKKGRRA